MKTTFFAVLALAVATVSVSQAAPVYNNTSTDTLITYFYSSGGFSLIGDSITLGGTDRILTDGAVQFYNNGQVGGTFSASLSFWNVGSPVGSQIGSSFVRNGLTIGATNILTVNFSDLNLLVPDNLIFTVGVSNVASGLELGLNAFQPPSLGSSDSSRLITGVPNGLVTNFSTSTTAAGAGNLYLSLEATAVPEPSTLSMFAGAAVAGLLAARMRARK